MARTRFRNPKAVPIAGLAICFTAFLAGNYFWEQSDLWLAAFFACFGILAIVASVETWTAQVYLGDTAIQIFSNFKRAEIRREEIAKVVWESGSGVSIQLQDRGWVRMPEMFHDSQGLCNSIRAWAKRCEN
jgi:hypothetical protein